MGWSEKCLYTPERIDAMKMTIQQDHMLHENDKCKQQLHMGLIMNLVGDFPFNVGGGINIFFSL